MDYSGMTVNERLLASDKLKKFDTAVKSKNKEELISILKSISLSEANINDILNKYKL